MTSPLSVLTCSVGNTNPDNPLGLEIWVDDQLILDIKQLVTTVNWSHEISDDPAKHVLKFVLKNKTQDHTVIDDLGNIISDTCLTITDIKFDGIELGHLFVEESEYHHDFNGTAALIQQKFYGTMGCNGSVSLKFSTPIYLWLLEHL